MRRREQEQLLADGATEIGGPLPINTDRGLMANGEPIGTRVDYAQVHGAPGTAAVTILFS